jgi:hypothetical protein
MVHKPARILLVWSLLGVLAFAADPGVDLPNDPALRALSQIGDGKKGSLLIYNFYSSSPSGGGINNTRIAITNTNPISPAFVHVFFIDGVTCSVADAFICLTANHTASFLTSDIDPGITGYIVALATDQAGLPARFDWLIGDAYVKIDSGHAANLPAEAVSVPVADRPYVDVPGSGQSVVDLVFDGSMYSRLPRTIAADNVTSRADSNDILLIVNRIGGNLGTGAGAIGSIFGTLYDDGENGFSWTTNVNTCQLRTTISNSFPRTTPRFEVVIPAGRTGWFKFYAASTVDQTPIGGAADSRAILGAIFSRNPNVMAAANAFSGGHNLHILTLNPVTVMRAPVFPPNC